MAQETSVDPELTARENLRVACDAYGVPRAERASRIDELLELVELTDVASSVADDFSVGMKKRLDAATSEIGLVDDIENGMFEKTLVSPMNRTAVFLGKTLAEVARIVVQVLIVLGLGVLLGAEIATGIPGAVAITAICVVFSVWFTAFSNVLAVLTRDEESTIIGSNLLQLPLLFVSSAFLPLSPLPNWIQTVAALNPVTYGVDAARAVMLGKDTMTVFETTAFGGIWDTLVPALGVLLGLATVLGTVAIYSSH